jgi:hypothetical protein
MTRIVTKASAGKFAKVTRAKAGALVKVGHIKGMSFKLVSSRTEKRGPQPGSSSNGAK